MTLEETHENAAHEEAAEHEEHRHSIEIQSADRCRRPRGQQIATVLHDDVGDRQGAENVEAVDPR